MIKPELLAPAGNLEKLKYAIAYGADAVYLGSLNFGLRVQAAAFDEYSMEQGLAYAHRHGVKVYVTLNIFAHNKDLEELPDYICLLNRLGVDGVIVSDPGVFTLVQELAPNLNIHVSTQANTTNWRSAKLWETLGAKRVILARELNLEEIAIIRNKINIELEAFVHGAMCISYSGRCLLSNYFTGRNANLGDCAQSCRWKYNLVEEKRPGEFFPIYEDELGSYILSSRDLCLLSYLPELVSAGVTSFKIEGRVKSVHYLATITSVYRQAIDSYLADPDNYHVKQDWLEEISKVSNREYTTGFINSSQPTEMPSAIPICQPAYTFVGVILGYSQDLGMLCLEQRNRFQLGETLEILTPEHDIMQITVKELFDADLRPIEAAPHPQQQVYLPWPEPLPKRSLLRRSDQ